MTSREKLADDLARARARTLRLVDFDDAELSRQYDPLMSQVFGFQHQLGDQHDVWSARGVQAAGNTVKANLDQSAAFLNPRAHTLYIVNYPDQSQYSPLYNGDSIYHLWYQVTQISDKINQKMVSGVINANIATANVYGNVIRDSGVCNGA